MWTSTFALSDVNVLVSVSALVDLLVLVLVTVLAKEMASRRDSASAHRFSAD